MWNTNNDAQNNYRSANKQKKSEKLDGSGLIWDFRSFS